MPRISTYASVLISLATAWGGSHAASAQTAAGEYNAGPPANVFSLVRQDSSDCTNSNVNANDPSRDGGIAIVNRNNDGTIGVEVAMTVSPNTTYHFFLKCVRLLGDITTGDEGTGKAFFTIPGNAVGPVFAFDMYPEGAPAGNKFQSVTVKLP
jgi:hypothetical protein